MPGLPRFLGCHPDIQLHISEGDLLVDLVAEGVDCVIRVGTPADSGIVGRKLGLLPEATFASPAYLERHGTARSPDELDGHRMIGFVSTATQVTMPLEFQTRDGLRLVSLPVSGSVSAAATNASLALLGFGLIQVPRYRVARELLAGTLAKVLADYPPTLSPVYLHHSEGRQLSPRVPAFIEWASASIGASLAKASEWPGMPAEPSAAKARLRCQEDFSGRLPRWLALVASHVGSSRGAGCPSQMGEEGAAWCPKDA